MTDKTLKIMWFTSKKAVKNVLGRQEPEVIVIQFG